MFILRLIDELNYDKYYQHVSYDIVRCSYMKNKATKLTIEDCACAIAKLIDLYCVPVPVYIGPYSETQREADFEKLAEILAEYMYKRKDKLAIKGILMESDVKRPHNTKYARDIRFMSMLEWLGACMGI